MTYDEILTRMILALEENDIGRFIELSYQIETIDQNLNALSLSTQSTNTSIKVTTTLPITKPIQPTQAKLNITSNSVPPSHSSPLVRDMIVLQDDIKTETNGEDCKFIHQ